MKTVYLGLIGDIIHPGLINIISQGARYGELTVGLYTDEAIATKKRLPYLTYDQRLSVVESIKGVSRVVPQHEWSYVPNLKELKPDYIIHGDDWKTNWQRGIRDDVFNIMKEWGGEVIEIPYTKGISSSGINQDIKAMGTTPDNRLRMLRRLLQAKPLVRFLETHSGLVGLIIENLEIQKGDAALSFDGMWSSSLTSSTMNGKPDIESVDLTSRLQDLRSILGCTTKPIIYDGDTGGKPEHFAFTVRALELNGISAVIIEDKIGLKKNSLFGTEVKQELESIESFCEKIRVGKDAQVTEDFMIISRIECLIAGRSMEEALERAKAYIAAGSDGIMIHSKEKDGAEIREFCTKLRATEPEIPIVVVPSTYDKITEDELQSWGVNVVIYANHMLRASYPAMKKVAETILEHQRTHEANAYCMPIKDILELIPGTK